MDSYLRFDHLPSVPNGSDAFWMREAVRLALQGEGAVEPNPMVGCVIVEDGKMVGAGYHAAYGGDHAEISAIKSLQGPLREATLYVTLEPCCHHGKTPPCAQAVINLPGVRRVVVGLQDPFPQVDGGGLGRIRDAGIQVTVGVEHSLVTTLNRPYLRLIQQGRPWVIGKWAMTLDGKIATSTGDSKWISGEESRKLVHSIRGNVDGVAVGANTVEHDDPRLNARPPGARQAVRLIFDTDLRIGLNSQLVATCKDLPLIIFSGSSPDPVKAERLEEFGAEIVRCEGNRVERIKQALTHMGERRMTNILVEGGSELLGSFVDAKVIDELVIFIAPKLVGGSDNRTAVGGQGVQQIQDALTISDLHVARYQQDVCLRGRIAQPNQPDELDTRS